VIVTLFQKPIEGQLNLAHEDTKQNSERKAKTKSQICLEGPVPAVNCSVSLNCVVSLQMASVNCSSCRLPQKTFTRPRYKKAHFVELFSKIYILNIMVIGLLTFVLCEDS